MYDALNRAFAVTTGELTGHLNADEQYQPGALAKVWNWFQAHPQHNILFGAVVVTKGDGSYLCSRLPMIPKEMHTRLCHLCTFTAAMFYRRSVIEKLGKYFDTRFKCAGDADLVLRMIDADLRMGTLGETLSVFIDHGENLALSPQASVEQKRLASTYGFPAIYLRPFTSLVHRIRKAAHGHYLPKKQHYSFMTPPGEVRNFSVRSCAVWKR